MRHAAKAYMETQISTTNRGEILVMLYDGAIKFLSLAKERMEAKDYAAKGNLISKAMDVINELDCSLNAEKGGELTTNLHNLYLFCTQRLFTANCRMDQSMVDEVIQVLSGLRDAYAEIIDRPEALAACEQVSASQHSGQSARNVPMGGPMLSGGAAAFRARGAYGVAPNPQTQVTLSTPLEELEDPLPLEVSADLVEEEEAAQAAQEATPPPPAPTASRVQASALYSRFAGQG